MKIAIVDDLLLMAETLAKSLKSTYGKEIYAFTPEKLDYPLLETCELLLLDFDLGPWGDANDVLRRLDKLEITHLKIILFSSHKKPPVLMTCRHNLVRGYVNKVHGLDNIFEAIDTVMEGNTWYQPEHSEEIKRLMSSAKIKGLTAREKEVAQLVKSGDSRKEIANKLNISINTVHSHCNRIYDKLGINSGRQI